MEIIFPITTVTRSTLWDPPPGHAGYAMETALLGAQRRADTRADLPLCRDKWHILNLKSYDYNFISRIIFVTWINLSRFLFWLGLFKRYILLRISFLICMLEAFYFLYCALKAALSCLRRFYSPYKNQEAHASAEHDSLGIAGPWLSCWCCLWGTLSPGNMPFCVWLLTAPGRLDLCSYFLWLTWRVPLPLILYQTVSLSPSRGTIKQPGVRSLSVVPLFPRL